MDFIIYVGNGVNFVHLINVMSDLLVLIFSVSVSLLSVLLSTFHPSSEIQVHAKKLDQINKIILNHSALSSAKLISLL